MKNQLKDKSIALLEIKFKDQVLKSSRYIKGGGKGYSDGFADGEVDGYNAGYDIGYDDGYDAGLGV